MVFSSALFLFGFLPLVLAAYYLAPQKTRNAVLLAASLAFYAWGEVFYVSIMLLSIGINFLVGLGVGAEANRESGRSFQYLVLGAVANLALLVSFKYANFIADNLNVVLALAGIAPVDIAPVHLPLGISFFTFQAMSYIVDVYRREVPAQKNLFSLALYISLFPQLIAGPIVRYHDVADQIQRRVHSVPMFAAGVQRFIMGLAKKMLIANPLGEVADNVFLLTGSDLTMPLAWIGILAYTFQIYFDFSGYSDMAIGLGRMFGFRFLENFNYPYIARSMRDFWRRWHISLSTWFRDYVYIPLGGSRGSSGFIVRNLFIVFVLTGVWHGASWNFVVWGLFHGCFLAAERFGLDRLVQRLWQPLQHLYVMAIVVVSWVFFRAETLPDALRYLGAMTNAGNWDTSSYQLASLVTPQLPYVFVAALILATPVYPAMVARLNHSDGEVAMPVASMLAASRVLGLTALMLLSVLAISYDTYNPFIYFRF